MAMVEAWRRWPSSQAIAGRGILLLVSGVLITYRFALSFPAADSSGRASDVGLDPGWVIIADDPPIHAAILGTRDELLALQYLTQIWGVRSDLRPVTTAQARKILVEEGILYSTVSAVPIVQAEVRADAHFSSAGVTLVAVRAEPQWELPALEMRLMQPAGDGLRLLGISYWRPAAHPALPERFRPQPRVTLYWQAERPIAWDWSVSVRPIRGEAFLFVGDRLVQTDRVHPVQGTYPTSRWQPGEVVRDDYELPSLPDSAVDGLLVIVYRPLPEGGFQNLAELRIPMAL